MTTIFYDPHIDRLCALQAYAENALAVDYEYRECDGRALELNSYADYYRVYIEREFVSKLDYRDLPI